MKFKLLLPAFAALFSHTTAATIPCPLDNGSNSPSTETLGLFAFRISTPQSVPLIIDGYTSPILNPGLQTPILRPYSPSYVKFNYHLEYDGAIGNQNNFVFGRHRTEDKSLAPKALYFGPRSIIDPIYFDQRGPILYPRDGQYLLGQGIIVDENRLKVQLIKQQPISILELITTDGGFNLDIIPTPQSNTDLQITDTNDLNFPLIVSVLTPGQPPVTITGFAFTGPSNSLLPTINIPSNSLPPFQFTLRSGILFYQNTYAFGRRRSEFPNIKQEVIFGDLSVVNPFIWTAIDRGDGKWYLRNWGSGSAGASIGNGIVVDQGKLKVLNVGYSLPAATLVVGTPQAGIGEVDYSESYNQRVYKEQFELMN